MTKMCDADDSASWSEGRTLMALAEWMPAKERLEMSLEKRKLKPTVTTIWEKCPTTFPANSTPAAPAPTTRTDSAAAMSA